MIIRGPGVPAGRRVSRPVSTVDLGPIFFEYGAAEPLITQHEASLRPLIERGPRRISPETNGPPAQAASVLHLSCEQCA